MKIMPGSAILPARYEFASLENRLLIDYLLQEDARDCRYLLADYLLDPERTDAFDLTLIDAPPRLTAGAINAFCASTHLLVPTLYDGLSAEAVGTFLNGADILKHTLNPCIDLLGVAGMLTQQSELVVREENAKRVAMSQVETTWGPTTFFL